MPDSSSTFLFSHPDFENEFVAECARFGLTPKKIAKGLFALETTKFLKHKSSLVWMRDVWSETEIIEFESIAKSVAALRTRSKLPWVQVTNTSHRRGELIEAEFYSKARLAKLRTKKRGWPDDPLRERRRPAFTLLGPNRMALCASPLEEVPGGEWLFEEDRDGPPSRAYLKLWEWGWRSQVLPREGQTALDLGASPGGWTWVLAQAGLHVHAFDRSPLKLDLPKRVSDRIQFTKADAFQMTPDKAPRADWVFCDVIAEPRRTAELIEAWVPTKAGLVFTIKFKGESDFETIARLLKIPTASVRHLDVNKHEVTFWRPPVSE